MSENKENSFKRSKLVRKSFGPSKHVLANGQQSDSSELSDEFAGYIDYVHQLQEDIGKLKDEKDRILETCNSNINNIKSAYGNEIDSLRKALDDSTREKCSFEYQNNRLIEDNNNIRIKYAKKIDNANDLQDKLTKAESEIVKNRKNVDNFETMKHEHEDLLRNNILINEQIKNEITMRTEAESRILTLCDEVEFIKKVNNSSSNAVNYNDFDSANNKTEAYYGKVLEQEITAMRDELTAEFDEYKSQLKETSDIKFLELTKMNNKLNEKCNKLYNEKKVLLTANCEMEREIAEMNSRIISLNSRETKHQEIVANINAEHEAFTKEIFDENALLKEKYEQMSLEITELINEKIASEKDKYIFRSMLKGEQSRFNLTDITSPKRKSTESEECHYEIDAWSKEGMKLYCDSNYDGSFVELRNDSNNAVNLNEWRMEVRTESGKEIMHTFPSSRIIRAGQCLKVWSIDRSTVDEDDCNVVMNTNLPAMEPMSCKLINDIDEMQATFDVRAALPTRKILKVAKGSTRSIVKKPQAGNETCLIM